MRTKATVYIVYDTKAKALKKSLKLRVTFAGEPRVYATNSDEKFTKDEWLWLKDKVSRGRGEYPLSVEKAKKIADDIVSQLGANFTFDEFSATYRKMLYGNYTSTEELQSVYEFYKQEHHIGLSEHSIKDYQAAVNWALKCKPRLRVAEMTSSFVRKLVDLLEADGKSVNTIKMYLRELKAIYNFAVKKGVILDTKPFDGHKLGSTRKKNIGLSHDIFQLVINYSGEDKQALFGRDFFLLSFLFNGNYLSDILHIKNRNIGDDGNVRFSREKTKNTGLEICLTLTDLAIELLNKYGTIDSSKPNDYVLPYLQDKTPKQQSNIVHDINKRVSKGLAELCTELNIPKITVKQARNTYASLAMMDGRNMRDIQSDLGHANIQTTIGYMNSISSEALQQGKTFKERLTKHLI